MAHDDLSEELDQLAFSLEAARDFRRLLTIRLGGVAVGAVLLSAVHLLPWVAGGVTAGISLAAVGGAAGLERHAGHRLMQSRLSRYLPQSDIQPTVP